LFAILYKTVRLDNEKADEQTTLGSSCRAVFVDISAGKQLFNNQILNQWINF